MSSIVTFNGSTYIIPATGDVGWGSNVSNYLIAIAAGCLQKTGGSFTLSAETDFGASFGLKSLYYKTRGSNVASTGAFRLANAETGIAWRNADNSADLALTVNSSNQLSFNGTPIESNSLTSAHILVGNGSNIATDVAMTGDLGIDNTGLTTIQAGVVTSAKIAATTIVNSNISASAAIAYSKLALTGSIVNADISTSAAIAITKVANGTANQVLGTNNAASANEWKTLTSTANQVTVTHGTGTVTFSTPQNIDTAAAVQFGTLALGSTLDASSILSLTSTTKGLLPPRMTTTQRNAISTPTDGLIVYDSSLAELFLRAGGAWTPLSVGGGSGTVSSGTQYQLGYYATSTNVISGLTLITGSRALASDTNGLPVAATTTATELGYVNGVTSAIQTQLGLKAPLAGPTFTGDVNINGTNNSLYVTSSGGPQFRINPSTSDSTIYIQSQNNFGMTFGINNAITAMTISTAGVVAIRGTNTNDSAAAGNVGQTVSSSVGATNYPSTGTYGDLTSISLTAGDWLVTGCTESEQNGATGLSLLAGVSTTSGNSSTGLTKGDTLFGQAFPTANNAVSISIPSVRFSLSGTTTVYLKYNATFSVGTPQAYGRISAVRIR